MKNRVVHFEIHADDVERAKEFYEQVFGWVISKWEGMEYWVVMTAEKDSKEAGINGGLLKRPVSLSGQGSNAFVCTIQVDNFDLVAEKILKAGGNVALPKADLGGVAWQGYFLDTEGNTFGLHQTITA